MIWRDHAQFPDAVLSSGEVAILSGAGKSGKSYITLALAVAAAQAEAKERGYDRRRRARRVHPGGDPPERTHRAKPLY